MDEQKRSKKSNYIPVRLDAETLALLDNMAVNHENNRGLTIRELIRQAAKRNGKNQATPA